MGVYSYQHFPIHNLSRIIKYIKHKIGAQFNSSVLVVAKNNYATKTVNIYIIFDLDNCSKNSLNSFILKNCLFGATITVETSNNSMCILAMEWYLMVQICGVLVMILLGKF